MSSNISLSKLNLSANTILATGLLLSEQTLCEYSDSFYLKFANRRGFSRFAAISEIPALVISVVTEIISDKIPSADEKTVDFILNNYIYSQHLKNYQKEQTYDSLCIHESIQNGIFNPDFSFDFSSSFLYRTSKGSTIGRIYTHLLMSIKNMLLNQKIYLIYKEENNEIYESVNAAINSMVTDIVEFAMKIDLAIDIENLSGQIPY